MKLATLGYIHRDNQTLMLHRTKKANDIHEGKWNGVGGKFEAGESPEECMIREIHEETWLIVENTIFRWTLTFPNFLKGEDWYVFVYDIYEFSGELIDCNEGELEWIDDDKILSLNLWEGDAIFMEWLQDGKFFSGKFTYEDGKLISHNWVFH